MQNLKNRVYKGPKGTNVSNSGYGAGVEANVVQIRSLSKNGNTKLFWRFQTSKKIPSLGTPLLI